MFDFEYHVYSWLRIFQKSNYILLQILLWHLIPIQKHTYNITSYFLPFFYNLSPFSQKGGKPPQSGLIPGNYSIFTGTE